MFYMGCVFGVYRLYVALNDVRKGKQRTNERSTMMMRKLGVNLHNTTIRSVSKSITIVVILIL